VDTADEASSAGDGLGDGLGDDLGADAGGGDGLGAGGGHGGDGVGDGLGDGVGDGAGNGLGGGGHGGGGGNGFGHGFGAGGTVPVEAEAQLDLEIETDSSESAKAKKESRVNVPVEAEAQLDLETVTDSIESAKAKQVSRLNGRLRNIPIVFKSTKRHMSERRAKPELKGIEIDPKGAPKTTVDFLALHCILPPHQITRFKQLFEQVDVDSSNTFDKDQLTQALLSMNTNLTLAEVDHTMRVLELLGGTGTCFKNADTGEIEVTFVQFATIAALSEKISSLDAATQKVANDMNFEALERKLQRAKEIFSLHDTKNEGEIPLDQVQIILQSGRIAEEHQQQVMTQLAAQGFDSMSFFDFLAYVPLFVDIHDDIITHTLSSDARPAISDVVNAKLIGRRWAKNATSGAGVRQ
jgi:Ca2+-binding EF-hand superfamily protein